MTKSIKILSILFLIFLQISVKQANSQEQKLENSLLWEISGNGLKQSSFLFGTIHIIPEKDFVFTDLMKEKFDSCKILALEVDMDMSLKQKIDLAKRAMYPKGKSLQDYMTKEEYSNFKKYILKDLGLKKKKFKQINKIQPIFASSIILMELLDDPIAYEMIFSKRAKKNNMKAIGLETIEYQMSVVEKMSIEDQVKMTFSSDKQGKRVDMLADFTKMVEAYKKQDLNALQKMITEEGSEGDFEKDFLITRNNNWVDPIEKSVKENRTFFAVGAAHLPGEIGVINLLRKKGYTVKAVK